jgi:hypothetical protein
MTTITYDIYRFYSNNPAEVYADKFKTVTTSDPAIVAAFEDAGALHVGACYTGCKVVDIVKE